VLLNEEGSGEGLRFLIEVARGPYSVIVLQASPASISCVRQGCMGEHDGSFISHRIEPDRCGPNPSPKND